MTIWSLTGSQVHRVRDRVPGRGLTRCAQPAGYCRQYDVTEFAALARSGAILAGDRRVSRQGRTLGRHTFRGLAQESREALGGDGGETAVRAMGLLIDLACEMEKYDYFRSEDPVEAARFVVPDEVAAMWSRLRDTRGANHMIE